MLPWLRGGGGALSHTGLIGRVQHVGVGPHLGGGGGRGTCLMSTCRNRGAHLPVRVPAPYPEGLSPNSGYAILSPNKI